MEKKEDKPFSDPERMRRGMQAVRRTKTLIECADGIPGELKLRNPIHPEAGWMQVEIEQFDEEDDTIESQQ